MLPPQPVEHTALLNKEMQNPHLVETMIVVNPTTGRLIQRGEEFNDWVRVENHGPTREWLTYQEKMTGQIPAIELNFNIQGVPLLLTAQSYLTLRITPKLPTSAVALSSVTGAPLTTEFEIERSGWPKLNSLVVQSAQATLSNFGTESYYGFFNNYIRAMQLPEELRNNMGRQFNENICVPTFNTLFAAGAANVMSDNLTMEYTSRGTDRHLYACSIERTGSKSIQWSKDNSFEVRIPLAEILPVFQIPVIPLGQTNTSTIQLRLVLRSPKHLFFMSRCFNAPVLWNGFGANTLQTTGLQYRRVRTEAEVADRIPDGRGGVIQGVALAAGTSQPNTLIGYDLRLAESAPPYSNVVVGAVPGATQHDFFACDIQTEAYLNLKVLTNPLLNPLSEVYLQPFINEMNEFRAKFMDSFVYSQHVMLTPGVPKAFRFSPSQLFYNATHVGLFFYTQDSMWGDMTPQARQALLEALKTSLTGRPFNHTFTEISAAAGPAHGYYTLPSSVGIHNFQIGLGSSCTPLYSQPLDKITMLSATEDCFKKYNPAEMFGQTVQTRKRLSEGDAFFLFDLTHTRDSGYFIDADNMITVSGEMIYNRGDVSGADALKQATSLNIEVVLVIFYQNTFTVLLDLDGAVLIQQT